MASSSEPRILVTRPQPGADKTAERLTAIGMKPVVLPFTEMVGLEVQRDGLPDLFNADAVVVTSANALRYVAQDMLDDLKELPVYAVGDATRDMAEASGFRGVISADGDARDLIGLVSKCLKPRSRIVYLCGRTRTTEIEDQLSKLSFALCVIETYQTKKVSQLTYKMKQTLDRTNLDGVLLYSSVSAKIYNEVWLSDRGEEKPMIPICFCISERAKSCLESELQGRAIVSVQPRDDAMIATVSQYFGSKI